MKIELAVQSRVERKKQVKKMRKQNLIPWIVYGKHIKDPILVCFQKQEFIKLYKDAGRSTPITLKWEHIDNLVLIQDLQVDPVSDVLLHVDFLGLKKDEAVRTKVSIILQWQSPLEKLNEGKIQQVKYTLEIEAKPEDLPRNIVIDISKIQTVNDVIFVKDLPVNKGVKILDDEDLPVVTVVTYSEEVETAATGAESAAGTAWVTPEAEAKDGKKPEAKKPEADHTPVEAQAAWS